MKKFITSAILVFGSLLSSFAQQGGTPGGDSGGAVASVFGRTGIVVAVPGDYTPLQVGAVPVGGYYAGTSTGLVNVLAISLNASLGTPTQAQLIGIPLSFTVNLANTTTTPTLNVNGLGAITIVKYGAGASVALAAGDLALNPTALVIYNGISYVLQNPQVAITQASTSATQFMTTNFRASSAYTSSNTSGNVTFQGGQSSSAASTLGGGFFSGAANSGTGGGGFAILQAGSAASGLQGFADVQQSFITATALAATFEAVSITSTADQVAASSTGSVVNVGIAQTVGGTNTQLFVVSHGKTTARFDGTPAVGDVACYPLTGGTTGLLHDNGSTACTLGESAGVVTGQVSGTGSGATATVLIR